MCCTFPECQRKSYHVAYKIVLACACTWSMSTPRLPHAWYSREQTYAVGVSPPARRWCACESNVATLLREATCFVPGYERISLAAPYIGTSPSLLRPPYGRTPTCIRTQLVIPGTAALVVLHFYCYDTHAPVFVWCVFLCAVPQHKSYSYI